MQEYGDDGDDDDDDLFARAPRRMRSRRKKSLACVYFSLHLSQLP